MKPERLIVYSLFSCILFSSVGLILSAQLAITHRCGFGSVLILSFFYQHFRWRWNRWAFNLSALLILVLSLVYGIWFAENSILAAIYFIGYTASLRMFELESPRDYKLALLLSLFEVSAASLMLVSFRYFLLFLAWLLAALFSLSLVTIHPPGPAKKPLSAVSRLFGLLAAAGIFSIITGLALFFFLPRIGFSLISLPIAPGRAFSGFSSMIRIGEVSNLLSSKKPVMRVSLPDHPGEIPGIKWRMQAMEHYENRAWQDRLGMSGSFPIIYNQPTTVDREPPPGEDLVQEIYLEPGIGPGLPAAGHAYAYQAPYKFRTIDCYFNNYCALPAASFERIHYLAYSVLPEYSDQEIRNALSGLDDYLQKRGNAWAYDLLQLPSKSDQICTLAQETAGNEADPLKKMAGLKLFFQNNFQYSLSGLPTGPEAIENFLLTSRKGNCEYFATGAALMLRCLGIPNRLAAGFISGDWIQYQGYYLVRERDAHTWVEIFLPGLGFMEFDPTPAISRRSPGRADWLLRWLDPIVFRWDRWIVEFSVQDQFRGLRKIEAETSALKYRVSIPAVNIRFWIRSNPGAATAAIAVIISLIVLAFGIRDWKHPARKILNQLGPDQCLAAKIYLEMFAILKAKGINRKDSATGLEIAREISAAPAAEKIVRRITSFYYQVRFGRNKAGERSLSRARADLEQIKKLKTWSGK